MRRFNWCEAANVFGLEHDGATGYAPGRLGREVILGFLRSHRDDLLWFVNVLQEFYFVVAGVEMFAASFGEDEQAEGDEDEGEGVGSDDASDLRGEVC